MQPEVQERIVEAIYETALAEKEAAQLLAQHWQGASDRVLAMAQQELEADGVPVQPYLLKVRFWGDRAFDIRPSILWELIPLTFKDFVARLSIAIMTLWFLNLALEAIESKPVAQVNSDQVQISFTQEY